MRFGLVILFFASSAFAQTALQQKISVIAADARGKVSVACSLPGSNLNCDLNPHARPPMQSVFKLPLAITAIHLIEEGKFSLDQPVRFLPSDRILPQTGCERFDWFIHELHARRRWRFRQTARKHIVLN